MLCFSGGFGISGGGFWGVRVARFGVGGLYRFLVGALVVVL